MKKIQKSLLVTVSLLFAGFAYGQKDAENMANARNAVDVFHKCDEAMRYLNLVSTNNRQTPEYLLCMGKTQDCMKNNDQALYYYNKYLAQKPADDSVKKRAAELTDQKNKTNKMSGEERKANNLYKTATKHRKMRHMNLSDDYYSAGIGYGMGIGGDKAPFKSQISLNYSSGFPIINNHAVIDYSFASTFMTGPNRTWFVNAAPTAAYNGDPGTGFSPAITLGFSPILINNKDIALTAGAMGGVCFYMFPGPAYNYSYMDVSISSKVLVCYGIKSDLFIGQIFMMFMNLQLATSNTAHVSTSLLDYNVPTNYGMLTIGAAVRFNNLF